LQVAVRVAVGEQHLDDVGRQRSEQRGVGGRELALDEAGLVGVGQRGERVGVVRERSLSSAISVFISG
jgi:hypothetical protein